MEASALHAPALTRRPLSIPLLRLRSDEQLVALFRSGSEDAFAAIHDRYRQRLFAYVRQMMAKASRADAEDVLQDVFVRAYGALRADGRDVNLRAWLYRVAHNRCIDHLRRPTPPAGEVFEMSRTPLQDPIETAQRRDDLQRLVDDVGRLPDQQRSALLMREIDGLAYADIAAALDVTVPAVKSLLVRARIGLTEAAEARDTDCAVIRDDLMATYDRGVKASGRARRHMRECAGCREYRTALQGMRRSFAALSPAVALGPLAVAAKALGIGGAGGGAAAGGSAALTGGAGLAGTATACKVAAVVCTAVVATGGAVEVKHLANARVPGHHARHATAQAAVARTASAPATPAAAHAVAAPPVTAATILHRTDPVTARPGADRARTAGGTATVIADGPATEPDGAAPVAGGTDQTGTPGTGGVAAPTAAADGSTGASGTPAGDALAPDGQAGTGSSGSSSGGTPTTVTTHGTGTGTPTGSGATTAPPADAPAATDATVAPAPTTSGPSPEH
jgi:RNA polymerase sigma factor (sigma-70 family)